MVYSNLFLNTGDQNYIHITFSYNTRARETPLNRKAVNLKLTKRNLFFTLYGKVKRIISLWNSLQQDTLEAKSFNKIQRRASTVMLFP